MQQPTSTPMVAPVVEVTLFEDRAQALRRASLEVAAGTHRLELDAVSPILSDRSLRAELVGSSTQHARLLDFRVRREVVTSDKQLPGDLPELVAERRRRTEALRAIQKHREAQSAELEQLGEITTQLLREAAEDTGWGRSEPERWRTELADLRTRQAALQAEILALVHGYEDAERELEDLGRRIRASKGWDARLRCWIEVDLEVDRPTALILELAYVVPGACWRPRYRATLSTKPTPALALEMQANVWQNTGEAWENVQLHFSTQRPSLGTEPPLLEEDLLHVRPRQEQMVIETREQSIRTTGLGQATRQADELPGVDDGGEPVNLRSEHLSTVPSDGRPYRVPIGSSQGAAKIERVAMAELANAVLLRCTAHNRADHPLLAGPVDLVADAGRVGRAKLGFVAPGERLELGFGPDASLRVFRRAERVEHEPGMLSRWHETEHRVEILLSNLGAEPRRVQVVERVPVSEVEQVQVVVDRDETTSQLTPDKDGLLRWERDLAPDATDTVELAYTVRRRSNVAER